MVDSARREAIVARGQRLLILKACIIAFVAAHLYAVTETGTGTGYAPLLLAISATGAVLVSAPALAKGHARWAVATILVWTLSGWLIASGLSWIVGLFGLTTFFSSIQSILVKTLIVFLYLKTYLDFMVFREATRSPE